MTALPKQLYSLAESYRNTKSPCIFKLVIDISRPVIFYTLHTLKKYKVHLREYEDEELYDTAVLGIYKFLAASLTEWKIEAIIPRLISHMMAEINTIYRYRPQVHYVASDVIDRTTCSNEQEIINNQIEIRDQFNTLIHDGVITFDEFSMLTRHIIHGIDHGVLAMETGVCRATIQRRIKSVKHRIRCEWEKRGWDIP